MSAKNNMVKINASHEVLPTQVSNAQQSISGSEAQTRALAEIQAQVYLAKQFPRDEEQAAVKIARACSSSAFASGALYSYPRGRETVKGPSIRLAELLALNWGNLAYGINEVERIDGASIMEAFCWDMERNVRSSKRFNIEHKGGKGRAKFDANDPRDLYELTANQGARRLRAVILAIIPPEAVEAAVRACEATLLKESGVSRHERIKTALIAFDKVGVTKEDIERRYAINVSQLNDSQLVELRGIYQMIADNLGTRDDYFSEAVLASDEPRAARRNELVESIRTEVLPISSPSSPARDSELAMFRQLADEISWINEEGHSLYLVERAGELGDDVQGVVDDIAVNTLKSINTELRRLSANKAHGESNSPRSKWVKSKLMSYKKVRR